MPRQRRSAPKHWARCGSCGALHPSMYSCDCNESQLIARVFQLFPGAREIDESHPLLQERPTDEGNLPMVQGTGNGGYNEVADVDTCTAVSRQAHAPEGDRFTGVFHALAETYRGSDEAVMKWTKIETVVAAKCKDCDEIVASGDAHTMNTVFEKARDHAEQHAHRVVIRQVERIEVHP